MSDFTVRLLEWYDRCARTLPWRGIHDPYRTWVSEAMLQQTRVETVLSYYDRFLERFPALAALAAADESDVLKQWEGLGYYSRARNLWQGARQIMKDFGGEIPSDPALLRTVQGIGPYTAGAVASIAFGVPVPAVDGNVIRVLSRFFGLREDASQPENKRKLEALAASLVPAERPGDYNQAVMDLGATVCTPGTPDCDRCPLRDLCDACGAGDAVDLPRLPRAKQPRPVRYAVPVIFSGDRVLMRRRTEKLLQGLWCFPTLEDVPDAAALQTTVLKKLRLVITEPSAEGHARHVFTHLVWEMDLYLARTSPDAEAPQGYEFIPPDVYGTLPLPAAMRAAAALKQKKGTAG